MAKNFPGHLKLHVGESTEEVQTPIGTQAYDVNSLYSAFAEATGWRVCQAQAALPHSKTAGEGTLDPDAPLPIQKRLRLVPDAPIDGMLDIGDHFNVTSEEVAWKLLLQIDGMIQNLQRAESALQRQEAQLAASVGVNIRADESEILASKLQESLHRAVVQTASDAAAIYLLDEGTNELKMRSCWGLPTSALSKPARQLRGSMADLEALLGNAVLLENTSLAPEWGCPENYAAALCLPIGSPTMPHGTIWLWSNSVRDFSTDDIDSARAATDKILVDIERSILADEVLKTRSISRGVESASLIQATRLPDTQPLHGDYEIGGWTFQGQSLGGNFHSWNYNRYGEIVAALGDAELTDTSGAIVATTLQTIVETCWNAKHESKQVMRKSNEMLWGANDGDWRCSLGYLKLDPTTGRGNYAIAGSVQGFIVGVNGYRMMTSVPTLLGQQPDTAFENQPLSLEGGDLLVFASEGLLSGLLNGGLTQAILLETLQNMHDDPVDVIVDHLARQLPLRPTEGCEQVDRSILILRRRF